MFVENKFVVYTKDNCPSCLTAKNLLMSNGLQFDEIKLVQSNPNDKQMLIETFKNLNPNVRSVPYILYGNSVIGGVSELTRLIQEKTQHVNKSQILNEGK